MKQKQTAGQSTSKSNVQTGTAPKNSRPISETLRNLLNNKYVHLVMLVIIGVTFYINYNGTFDKKLDMNGDNIQYYSLGKSLHDGTGYSNVMGFEVTPHTHFPPGYPAFISVLLNFVKEGSFTPIKEANGWLLCLSIFLLFYIIKNITKNNALLAFTAAILFCVQKDLLRWSTIMMSEMLFLFLTVLIIFTALLLYRKKSFKEFKAWDYAALVVMTLSIAYVYFVRTMGLSLILGLVGWLCGMILYELWRYQKGEKDETSKANFTSKAKYYGCLILLVMLPFGVSKLAWDARNNAIGHGKSDYIGDFHKKGGNGEVMSTLSDWTERIYNNSKSYYLRLMPETVLSQPFDSKEVSQRHATSGEIATGFFVFALVMIGFLGLGAGGFLLFCYLAMTFMVLLVWPEQFTSVRYYVAIVPLLLFLFLHGIYNIVEFILRWVKNHTVQEYKGYIATLCTMAAAFFWLIPTQSKAQLPYQELAKRPYKKFITDQNCLNFFDALDWCKSNIPDSARMVCRKPELYYIHAGFKKSVSFPNYAPEDSVMKYLDKVQASHLILDNWYKHAYTTLYPAIKKYPEKFKVIHQVAEVDTAKKVNPVYIVQYNPDWGYHGELVDGKKEGYGVFNYQDGRKFEGNYVHDIPNGEGSLYDEAGRLQFKGTWKNGQYLDGKGYALYGDKKYTGEYRSGKPNGYGVYSDTLGNVLAKGMWRDGILVQPQ